MKSRPWAPALSLLLPSIAAVNAQAGDDPFADAVVSYSPGTGAAPGYQTAASALGSPERISGECFGGSDIVSAFSGAYCTDEIVSIGVGGSLVVQFATPVTDDPNNLHGIDLLVFGNASFIDGSYPNGVVSGLFNEGGVIEVSLNGVDWVSAGPMEADGLWPTVGYADSGPYDHRSGAEPTLFTRPVDPSLQLSHFLGLNNDQVMDLYRGSGGGAGVDLAGTGLQAIRYVRISLVDSQVSNVEIDAVADAAARKAGDVDLDGQVDVDDLLLLITAWGASTPGGIPADFDLNHAVNVDDLLVVINHWGR